MTYYDIIQTGEGMNRFEGIHINNLDHNGRGIGKINNQVVFIPNTLIGEIVDIEITETKKKYLEGQVEKFIKKSNDRVDSICSYYGECGGCDLMHTTYNNQLKYKENKIKDIFDHYYDSEVKINPIVATDELYYRNKITLKVDNEVGFHRKKTNDIIGITNCYIANKGINDLLNIIRNNIDLNGVYEIVIRYTSLKQSMVVFKINKPFKGNIDSLKPYCDSIVLYDGKYNTIYGNSYIKERIADMNFIISADSFFQVNTKQTEKIYKKVMDYCNLTGNEKVLALYCGTGTIGLFLSKNANKVLGIEINKYAIKDAEANKRINNIKNIDFKSGDVFNVIKDNNFKPDIIVVDPPRSGLTKETIMQIIKINPKKIVYVSCDPITLARDLNVFADKYKVKEVTPFDMFPNTYHVECVVLMSSKDK